LIQTPLEALKKHFGHSGFLDGQEQVIEQLRDLGIDPTGKETEGHLLAEFYLSRPARDVAAAPIGDLLAA